MKKSNHLKYFFAVLLLTVFTVALVSVLLLFSLSPNDILSLIIIFGLASGFISAKIIEKITHKEKKEILAGSLIALPATICIMIYFTVISNIRFIDTLDSRIASIIFFISFNIPFLIFLYEHERHKHHLVSYMAAPLILAFVYLFAYYISYFIASGIIQPQVIDSFTLNYDIMPVKSYVENCMKSLGREAVKDDVEIKLYIDAKLDRCIDSFSAFQDMDIDAEEFQSSVVYGESTVTINLYYPVRFRKGNFNYILSDFQTTIER